MSEKPTLQSVDLDAMATEYRKFVAFVESSKDLQHQREQVRQYLSPSPRDELYHEHSLTLFRYRRETPPTYRLPLLLIPSLVNKPFVMDMLSGESFVEAMLARGFDVFMLEWGEPTPGQRDLPIDHYVKQYMSRAVRRTMKASGAAGVSLAGYCLGGSLALLHAGYDKGERVKNLVTMVTPINFEDRGLLSWWAREEHFDIDKVVDTYGNVPAEFFSQAFPWIVPQANLVKLRTIYEKHHDEEFMRSFLALDIWGRENTAFPGEVYRSIIKNGYQRNALVTAGEWPLREGSIRMADVTMPVLAMAATYDHIAPCESCTMLPDILPNAECTSKSYEAGHLGIALGKNLLQQPTTQYWDDLTAWLAEHDAQ